MLSHVVLVSIAAVDIADASAVPHLNEQKLEKYKEMRLLMRDSKLLDIVYSMIRIIITTMHCIIEWLEVSLEKSSSAAGKQNIKILDKLSDSLKEYSIMEPTITNISVKPQKACKMP